MAKNGSPRAPRQGAGSGHGRDRGPRPAPRPDERPDAGDAAGGVEAPPAPARAPVPLRGRERAVLVAVVTSKASRMVVESHLDELAQLVDTAGGVVVARMVQERKSPDPSTFIGKGKVAELARLAEEHGAKMVVFDDDLSSSQARHLDEAMPSDVKVLDRAGVILDIFAMRARTREAQIQVELAQLNYQMSRLTRRWAHLSRQAGGIGTRGVGETQLESDRRVIRRRLGLLGERLDEVEREREVQRKRRALLPAVALVGYTNAGKSTLFEKLTGASTWSRTGCSRRSTRAPGAPSWATASPWRSRTPSGSSASCPTTWWRRSARRSPRRRSRRWSCTWWTARTPTGPSSSRSARRCSSRSASTRRAASSRSTRSTGWTAGCRRPRSAARSSPSRR